VTERLSLDDLPTPTLYDLFQDVATALTGLYMERYREATDESVAVRWWEKVLAVRELTRTVDPDDHAALAGWVTRWQQESTDLAQMGEHRRQQ
jgi:hypothetical protein